MGTCGKNKENTGVAWEPFENARKIRFCVGTNGKRKENIGFALEPMENAGAIQVLRGNH